MQRVYILSKHPDLLKHRALINGTFIREAQNIPANLNKSIVVLEWDSYKDFRSVYSQLFYADKILFQFGDVVIDMADEELIDSYKQEAIRCRNYTRLKTINRALIEYSVIRRMEDMNCMPSEIQLETTDICNAQCIMCSHFYRQGERAITNRKELLESLKDTLPYLETLYLHGNGECFLVENIDEYIAQIHSYGIQCTANTNLSVLTNENLKTIRQCFSELNVSIDGATSEVYESIRRGLSFEQLIKNCRRLREYCPRLYIRMWSVMMRQNINFLSDLVKLAVELQFDEVVFTELSSDRRLKNSEDVMLRYPQVALKEIHNAKEIAIKNGIRLVAPEYNVRFDQEAYDKELDTIYSRPLFHDEEYYKRLRSEIQMDLDNRKKSLTQIGNQKIPYLKDVSTNGICDWIVQRPFIDLYGNVSVCCINQHILLGNLLKQPFDTIWMSESARNVRRIFYQGKLPYFCSGCEFILQKRLQFLQPLESQKIRSKLYLGDQ